MKKILTAIAFLLAAIVASAQTETGISDKHEYSVCLTGGMSGLIYKLNSEGLRSGGKTEGGFGVGAGVGYSYNFSGKIGVSTGLEISTFKGKGRYDILGEEYDGADNRGDRLKYRYTIDGYEEIQNLTLFSVPIMFRYRTPVGRVNFYAAGGFKLGFPLSAEAEIQAGGLNSSGYYEYETVTYTDLPEYGFFTGYIPERQTSKIDVGFAAILSLESGVYFNLGNLGGGIRNALYAGIYFDYALNDLKKSTDKHPLNYNRDLTYESVLNSALADKLNLMSVGVKIRFSINLLRPIKIRN